MTLKETKEKCYTLYFKFLSLSKDLLSQKNESANIKIIIDTKNMEDDKINQLFNSACIAKILDTDDNIINVIRISKDEYEKSIMRKQ